VDLKLIFLIILGIVSIAYLVSLYFKFSIYQAVLKASLVPLVLAVYLVAADKILVLIVLALIFGWIGDIFLLKGNNFRFFSIGLVSFLLGHICYIIAMYGFIEQFNVTVLVISAALSVIFGLTAFRIVNPVKIMKIPVFAYKTIILVMVIFALQIFVTSGGRFGILVFTGSLLFLASDSTLAYDTFKKKTKYGKYFLMFTYILAQLLIALGFAAV